MHDRRRVREVFAEADAMPEVERAAFLTVACAGDDGLRREVESLLAAVARTPGFMASPTVGGFSEPPPEMVGTSVGPYKLLQEIGHGGFGAVYMASQEAPVRRRVAVKVLKLGMDTRAVIARFEAERQALAMMDHPHIAKVLDAGTTPSGRPYFVMELVAGDPITAHAAREGLTIAQRLELVVQVCNAVQHAHSKGVIHRDLKPGNILVSTQDGRPHAKVIDFGIAKAVEQKLTERTYFTEFRQFIGTPEYMSPEQAGGAPDVDARSDVYGLGVLLYELLTGATPLDAEELRGAAFDEVLRLIREKEPVKPSTRLSRRGVREGAKAVRRAEPGRLEALVAGDLDWIVMKALDKDRARRYETPQALAADIHRHLAGEPVTAAPSPVKTPAKLENAVNQKVCVDTNALFGC